MKKETTWVDRLNDSREHKGDIPNKLFTAFIMFVFGFWIAFTIFMVIFISTK